MFWVVLFFIPNQHDDTPSPSNIEKAGAFPHFTLTFLRISDVRSQKHPPLFIENTHDGIPSPYAMQNSAETKPTNQLATNYFY